jgi:hypothetical protein
MSIEKMAPEAFTNTELAEAMTWRENQPEYIQKMTGTPSSLMSFYKQVLRSRGGMGTFSAKSSEEFKADLKNLADGLRSFEKDPVAAAPARGTQPSAPVAPPIAAPSPSPTIPSPITSSVTSYSSTLAVDPLDSLDPESMKMVREIKQRLNLSHDREALRALIKLGFERLVHSL